MAKRFALGCLIAALLVTGGCSSSDPTQQTQYFALLTTDFISAQSLAVTAPMTRVIRDQPTWANFWITHGPVGTTAPTVDFTQDMLIAVFWGAGYDGCTNWADAITRVRLRIDGVNSTGVIEVDVGPVDDLGSCATPVLPLEVLAVDTSATPVQFVGMVPI